MDRRFEGPGGRFELGRLLGEGGMGRVHEAIDRVTGRRVALKALRERDASSVARFRREFRAAAALHHPNVARAHEFFEAGRRHFFTMELVEGCDFLRYVRGAPAGAAAFEPTARQTVAGAGAREGRGGARGGGAGPGRPVGAGAMPDESRLRRAFNQLVVAVDAVHGAGLVHRDIKPSNVLVGADGGLKLLDFGLARGAKGGRSKGRCVFGTARYMAPEQAGGGAVGPLADWYSVGVVLFEALTGTTPFLGRSADVLAHKRLFDAPAARAVVAGVPSDLGGLCEQLLRRDVRERERGRAWARALAASPAPASAARGSARRGLSLAREGAKVSGAEGLGVRRAPLRRAG